MFQKSSLPDEASSASWTWVVFLAHLAAVLDGDDMYSGSSTLVNTNSVGIGLCNLSHGFQID